MTEGHGAGEEGDDGAHVGREVAERGGRLFFVCEPNDRQIDRGMEEQRNTRK